MSKRCAREECGKTVYPMEELKCLDKVWHKTCFKCTVCGMALNMKNYKGYNKMPYCEPHYPKTVASVVADTPESRRIAENTKLQSQVQYHAEYEKMKGQKIQIADDPEITRHLANTKAQSQVAYTGELAKKIDQEHHRGYTVQADEQTQVGRTSTPTGSAYPSGVGDTPYSARLAQQGGTLIYSSDHGGAVNQPQRSVGSIADYDPMNGQWGTMGSSRPDQRISNGEATSSQQPLRVPVIHSNPNAPKFAADFAQEAAARVNGTPYTPSTGHGHAATRTSGAGFAVKAVYDYNAADKDEVTFLEGDIIVNCEKVDDGWMTGTVQRTRQWGMLPANYVESYSGRI